MSGRFHIIALISILSVSISCIREEIETDVKPVAMPSPDMGYEKGVMHVKFTDEMIGLVEEDISRGSLITKSSGLNLALGSLDIQKMERVFPHAGML